MKAIDPPPVSTPPFAHRMLAVCALLFTLVLGPASSAQAAELLMFETKGCPFCALWHRQIGPIYPKTAEGRAAPLRPLDLSQATRSEILFAEPVRYAPTFVLVEDGREVGRITGYTNDDAFWGLAAALLTRLRPPSN